MKFYASKCENNGFCLIRQIFHSKPPSYRRNGLNEGGCLSVRRRYNMFIYVSLRLGNRKKEKAKIVNFTLSFL